MNVLDIIIGVILILFAFAGLRKGLIIEAFYLASFIVGIYGAMFFSDAVAAWMSGFVNSLHPYIYRCYGSSEILGSFDEQSC